MQKLLSLAVVAAGLLVAVETRAETTGPDPDSYPYFISPTPNQFFADAPTTLDAEIGIYQGLNSLTSVELFVDDVSIGAMACGLGCVFPDIELAQGVHTLQAVADNGFSDLVTVYVAEEPPSETGGETDTGGEMETGGETESGGNSDTEGGEGAGEDAADEAEDDGASKGGGCEITERPSPVGVLALPALLLLPLLRRRD